MTTFSGYLVGISNSGYTASFDQAGLGPKMKILPVQNVSGDTLSGFLFNLARKPIVQESANALTAQSLVPGQNIPAESSNEAGLIIVGMLLTWATGSISGPSYTSLPQAILARLNGIAVDKDFIG